MRCLVVIRSREQTEANTQIPTYVCQDIMYVATCTEDGGWAAAAIAESLCLPRAWTLPTEAMLSISLDPEPAQAWKQPLSIITGSMLHAGCVVSDSDKSESDISLRLPPRSGPDGRRADQEINAQGAIEVEAFPSGQC